MVKTIKGGMSEKEWSNEKGAQSDPSNLSKLLV